MLWSNALELQYDKQGHGAYNIELCFEDQATLKMLGGIMCEVRRHFNS